MVETLENKLDGESIRQNILSEIQEQDGEYHRKSNDRTSNS
jgi:hypothetical protein